MIVHKEEWKNELNDIRRTIINNINDICKVANEENKEYIKMALEQIKIDVGKRYWSVYKHERSK